MELLYRVADGRTVKVEGATHIEMFRALGGAAEVFGETHCGLCGGDAIMPIAREAGGYEFFEWACTDPKCGARLRMSVRNDKTGRLFPMRRLLANGKPASGKPGTERGETGEHRGWTRYRGDADADHDADADTGGTGSAGPRTPPPTRPAPPASADAEPIDPGALLTAAQREAIGTALRVSGIGRQTFLAWCGYASPEVIPQHAYRKLLAAAQKPPKDLLAVQAR